MDPTATNTGTHQKATIYNLAVYKCYLKLRTRQYVGREGLSPLEGD
jgi:hypothetical protein